MSSKNFSIENIIVQQNVSWNVLVQQNVKWRNPSLPSKVTKPIHCLRCSTETLPLPLSLIQKMFISFVIFICFISWYTDFYNILLSFTIGHITLNRLYLKLDDWSRCFKCGLLVTEILVLCNFIIRVICEVNNKVLMFGF